MATRASILQRSKRVEREVVKFFAGPDAARAWKEDWDVAFTVNGRPWVVEVKSVRFTSIGDLWRIGTAALEQAESYLCRQPPRCLAFAAVWPYRCTTKLVFRRDGLGHVNMCLAEAMREQVQWPGPKEERR